MEPLFAGSDYIIRHPALLPFCYDRPDGDLAIGWDWRLSENVTTRS